MELVNESFSLTLNQVGGERGLFFLRIDCFFPCEGADRNCNLSRSREGIDVAIKKNARVCKIRRKMHNYQVGDGLD